MSLVTPSRQSFLGKDLLWHRFRTPVWFPQVEGHQHGNHGFVYFGLSPAPSNGDHLVSITIITCFVAPLAITGGDNPVYIMYALTADPHWYNTGRDDCGNSCIHATSYHYVNIYETIHASSCIYVRLYLVQWKLMRTMILVILQADFARTIHLLTCQNQ